MTEGTASPTCCTSPAVLLGKGLISAAHRGIYTSQISTSAGTLTKLHILKNSLQIPLFQWESLEQIVCVLAYMSRELHTSLGLVGRRLPFFSSSESRGEGGGVAFCPSIFFWGESSVTGVMGASRGAEPGGVSGIPMKEATGVLGNVPGVTWEREKPHCSKPHSTTRTSPACCFPQEHWSSTPQTPTPFTHCPYSRHVLSPFPCPAEPLPRHSQTAWPTHWGPYTAFDPGTGSPQTGKRISSSTVTNHATAPDVCKARQGLRPRPLLCDGCRAPCPRLGFPSHPEKDPYPWTGLIPSRLGQISEGIIPARGGGASRRTNHHPRESSRWVLNGLASWKGTETEVRYCDSIMDSPQELPLTLSWRTLREQFMLQGLLAPH